jgi:type IV pilus assembly protein PilM
MLAERLNSLLDPFKTKYPSLIGIDISSTGLKLVELSQTARAPYRLERYAIEPLVRDTVVDGNIANLDLVSDALKRAHKRLGSRNRNARSRFHRRWSSPRRSSSRPVRGKRTWRCWSRPKANQYIPFALDEVNLDFQTLGPCAQQPRRVRGADRRLAQGESGRPGGGRRGGRPEAAADGRRVVCDATGVRADLADAAGERRDQNIALVDIGAHVTHFYVLRNGQFLFSRDQAFGGNQLTHDIQRAFNLTPDEAESAKKSQGLPTITTPTCCSRSWRPLALEVTRALQFFFTSTSYNQVDQIVLAGGCALLPGIDELVAKRAGVATMIANPFAEHGNVRPDPAAQLAQDAPVMMIACGLALRGFE